MKTFKPDHKSKLFVKKVLERVMNPDGTVKAIKTQWIEADSKEISLGSVKKPKNTDLIAFDWTDIETPEQKFREFGDKFKRSFFG